MSNFFVNKFGRAGDVDAVLDVYDVSTGSYEFPTVATSTQVVGLANDIPSSDGVHSVQIEGLLANGTEVTEVATLNGTTPVVMTNSFYRVNRMFVKASGATNINSGQIRCTHSGSGTLAMISPLEGQTLQACYTLPAGIRGSIVSWRADAAREATQVAFQTSLRLQTRKVGETWRTRDSALAGNTNSLDRKFSTKGAIAIEPLMDIRVRVTAVNTNNGTVSAGFEIDGFRDIR